MRINPKLILGLTLVFAVGATTAVWAGPPAEEIAKLGNELTPMGAVKAGNSEGTIPAWDGGLTEFPAGYTTRKALRRSIRRRWRPCSPSPRPTWNKYADHLTVGPESAARGLPRHL